MYVYIHSDTYQGFHTYTVGFYGPDGKWTAESDHGSTEEAAKRVAWLNGSTTTWASVDLKAINDERAKDFLPPLAHPDPEFTQEQNAKIDAAPSELRRFLVDLAERSGNFESLDYATLRDAVDRIDRSKLPSDETEQDRKNSEVAR